MPIRGTKWVTAPVALLLAAALWGCRTPTFLTARPLLATNQRAHFSASPGRVNLKSEGSDSKSEIRPVSAEEVLSEAPDNLFARQNELTVGDYVGEVRRRNPSLQAAMAAWNAAAERYPQEVAFDDPMFQSMFAPASLSGASDVPSSFYVGVAQKIPWRGKRALRGARADAEADAASFDYLEAELRVALAAQIAFFDYYLVYRNLELNRANVAAWQKIRANAKAKYEANQVTQQDLLQADVELAKREQRRIDLVQMKHTATARLNALLHRGPELPLPPPPARLPLGRELPEAAQLRELALTQRPELSAQASRIEAERNSVALAYKEFYPDFEFMGRYDQFWIDHEQRAQLGMNMNLPVNKSRRRAAVREAVFKVSKMQAEYEQQVANIRQDVQTAYARTEAGGQTLRLFIDKLLPAAEDNVSAAVSAYEANKLDFLRLVEAQRQLIELQESQQGALAQYHRDLAELERATGGPLPVLPTEEEIPVPKRNKK